jgi:hypothetical protein
MTGLNPWHQAVLDACMVRESCYVEADPAKTVQLLLQWEAQCALDPAVSEDVARITDAELLKIQALADKVWKRRDAIIKVQKMLLMAPMKSNFTFTRDEMIDLFGLPDILR